MVFFWSVMLSQSGCGSEPRDGTAEISAQLLERQRQGGAPPNQHIIMSARKASPAGKADDLFQPPPHAVAFNGAADLSRNGEAHPDWPAIPAIERLQHEGRARDFATRGYHPEIGALSQPFHGGDSASPQASGAQAFAASPASCGNDLAAPLGRHARAKTVPALAHDLAWLIGAFHRTFSAGSEV
jgi:hypothetical protein